MNNKFIISIVVSLLIVLFYVFAFGASSVEGEKLTDAKVEEQIKNLQNKIDELKAENTNEELELEIKKLKQEIMQATSVFPSEIGITGLLKDVSIISESSGLQILLFQPMEIIDQGFYEELPIKLKLRGSYKQLASFFYGISSLDRIIKIQDMKITGPINNSGIIMTDSELIISTYRILGGA